MSSDVPTHQTPLNQFLAEARILILDSQFSSRVTLKNTLIGFGAKADNIQLARTMKEASVYMEQFFPDLIFSDFQLEDGVGTSLLKTDRKNFTFILISSLSTHSVVANASELEVDQFVFKPYSQSHLMDVLEGVVAQRQQPEEHNQFIEDGKELLMLGEFDKATVLFELAKKSPSSYSRACSYLGEIQKLKNDLDQSSTTFREGLASTEVHFRCLMGLFNSLIESGRPDEGYRVLKDILLYFPECPERLVKALDLSVRTKNFVDIEEMYVVFNLMFEKTEELYRFMSCGLLVNGSYHLRNGNPEAALESFIRALSIMDTEKHVQFVKDRLEESGIPDKLAEIFDKIASQKELKAA